ncbi:MAG: hypothetical protein M1343_04850 [Chloroflexi bacterium]|nr:hypothetical protein [Chloroflexota bacterium]MDA8187206.1 hypothetical protein [Dehalococcoidales bacterium]
MSYSTDGIIPMESLVAVLNERGRVAHVSQRYKRYRVSSQRYSPRSHSLEYVMVVDCC